MLLDLLKEKRQDVLDKWFSAVLETYPPQSARFMRRESNRFANPVGQTIARDIAAVFDSLLVGAKAKETATLLETTIKIRAVQNHTAAGAVAFVFFLKKAIRETLADDLEAPEMMKELSHLESAVDAVALAVFDIYMQNREKLSDIRVGEAKRQAAQLMERYHAEIVLKQPDAGRDSQHDNL